MARRPHAVQVVVADEVIFPAHRIVQRMRACIAPVPVEVVLGQRRLRARQLEQLSPASSAISVVSTFASPTATDARATSSSVTSPRAEISSSVRARARAAPPPHAAGCADGRPRESSADRRLPARRRCRPRPRARAHERQRIVERGLRDARVDRGLDDLRQRAVQRRQVGHACAGSTCDAGTRTLSSTTVPLAVVRCPNPDQSSITVSPGAGWRMYASHAWPVSSRPSTGT